MQRILCLMLQLNDSVYCVVAVDDHFSCKHSLSFRMWQLPTAATWLLFRCLSYLQYIRYIAAILWLTISFNIFQVFFSLISLHIHMERNITWYQNSDRIFLHNSPVWSFLFILVWLIAPYFHANNNVHHYQHGNSIIGNQQ